MYSNEVELYRSPEARKLLDIPSIALPTLAVCLLSFTGFVLSFVFFEFISLWQLFCLSAFLQYVIYTCLHEACHHNVAKANWINDWVGRVSAAMLFSPYRAFQYIHLKHHRRLNIKNEDPDLWSARHPLLLSWLTQDLYYYPIFFGDRAAMPAAFFWEAILQTAVQFAVVAFLVMNGHWQWVLFGWILPKRATVTFLSFSFNYLPHVPHDEKIQTTKYKETLARTSRWLDLPMLWQNFHNIHHLQPRLPFYRYRRLWELGREFYLQQGTHEVKKIFQIY